MEATMGQRLLRGVSHLVVLPPLADTDQVHSVSVGKTSRRKCFEGKGNGVELLAVSLFVTTAGKGVLGRFSGGASWLRLTAGCLSFDSLVF